MSTTTARRRRRSRPRAAADDAYLDLVRQFPLRPIRSAGDYDAASAVLDRLAVREASLARGERDYLETLELLIAAYDDEHVDLDAAGSTPLDRLRYLMDQSGMTAAGLKDLLGGSQPL